MAPCFTRIGHLYLHLGRCCPVVGAAYQANNTIKHCFCNENICPSYLAQHLAYLYVDWSELDSSFPISALDIFGNGGGGGNTRLQNWFIPQQ